MSLTSSVIRQLIDLKWTVKVYRDHITATKGHRFGSVPIAEPGNPDSAYHAVCQLATWCGIELDDG